MNARVIGGIFQHSAFSIAWRSLLENPEVQGSIGRQDEDMHERILSITLIACMIGRRAYSLLIS